MNTENNIERTEIIPTAEEKTSESKKINMDFKFFKSCSSTLKRFSVLIFVINLFLIIVSAAVGTVLIGVYIGPQMLTLLAVPVLCAVVILVVVSRLLSALIYGFAEIVEKYENK